MMLMLISRWYRLLHVVGGGAGALLLWNGMEYGMEWNGMEWNGIRNGMEWNGIMKPALY